MALTPTINLPETNVAFLHLLTITAASDVIRVVNNDEPVVSRGQTFDPYPFSLALPVSDGEKQPELLLNIDNVDQRLVRAIRELLTPPTVLFEMVLSVSPDVPISYDAMSIQFRLRPNNILARKFPSSTYSPARYRDLHFA